MKNLKASQGDNGVLLSSTSSRRKMAWKRLQSMSDRGMTQDQVTRYLEAHMKQVYQKVRKEGALTYDKVQKYLDRLAKTAAQSLARSGMDKNKVVNFANRIEPIVEDVGSKDSLTEEDIKRHTSSLQEQVINTIQQNPDYSVKKTNAVSGEDDAIQIEILEEEGGSASLDNVTQSEPETDIDERLEKEFIPVGLESGAPKMTLLDFFKLPLSKYENKVLADQPFQMHIRYLEMALKTSKISEEELDWIKEKLPSIPVLTYRKYYDIFPDNEYDDAPLMSVYLQWKNGALKQGLIETQD